LALSWDRLPAGFCPSHDKCEAFGLKR
jgi:hypothetical protein